MRLIAMSFAALVLPLPLTAESFADRLSEIAAEQNGAMSHQAFFLQREVYFSNFDTDGNAILDPLEQAALLAAVQFQFVDSPDTDRMRAARRAVMPDSLDLDGDAQISLAEFNRASETLFAELDRNGDGLITRQDALLR